MYHSEINFNRLFVRITHSEKFECLRSFVPNEQTLVHSEQAIKDFLKLVLKERVITLIRSE